MDRGDTLTPELTAFLEAQEVFFVATAPLAAHGHVNCSPKGGRDTLHVLDPTHMAYLDLTGSGAETVAHLRENGRITLMFASFGDRPRICRVYGTGTALVPDTAEYERLRPLWPPRRGVRALILVDVALVTTSCGFGVPIARELLPRDRLDRWLEGKGEPGLTAYRDRHNTTSLDGLPALD